MITTDTCVCFIFYNSKCHLLELLNPVCDIKSPVKNIFYLPEKFKSDN